MSPGDRKLADATIQKHRRAFRISSGIDPSKLSNLPKAQQIRMSSPNKTQNQASKLESRRNKTASPTKIFLRNLAF
jgi:hypothetical protein